ncbi:MULTISPECIES: class I SAM-dependent methyltransferase [unclassified Streptomyces]|uniref:class I SAM-dependent methyltransferase n=1 Tax=unclassified Streptomyces TaxID=2593676 RepID=UPI00224F3F24|nr:MULTISPECIES: class I SAM-dependent methyltransferase [unclassified Streptomyces]MCX4407045.1 class I SAM-dependent methyltransferase [Streptomyces sp. NBC_01764]MCX5188267.1 class I SAM-dependent methyltransferase [Streptomyces sp. NBC_00268]
MHATDFSATAPEQLTAAARESGLADRITTTVHDVSDPLPVPDASVDAVFAHMLLYMALSTKEIRATMDEIARSYARATSSSTPSATPATPTTGKASTAATASTNTAASPSTSSTRPS